MVPRRLYTWNVALLILLGLNAPAANAAPIEFTGNVPNDFNPATNPGVVVTPVSSNPLNIGQAVLDHRERMGLGVEHPGHPDVLQRLDRHPRRRYQHVQEQPGSERSLRAGQWRPDRNADQL